MEFNSGFKGLIHGVRARTSSLLALHHQHSCERKKSMHNRKLVTLSSTKLFPLRILRIHIAQAHLPVFLVMEHCMFPDSAWKAEEDTGAAKAANHFRCHLPPDPPLKS